MSDKQEKGRSSLPVADSSKEPAVGEGGRSLANWQKLATARRDIASNEVARASMTSDPHAFLASYGINSAAFAGSGGGAALTSLEHQLASSGVQRDPLGIQRCASIVVGPVLLAVGVAVAAAAVALAAAAVAAAAVVAANAVEAANAVDSANLAWSANAVHDNPFPW
jgi:hypothetical protein